MERLKQLWTAVAESRTPDEEKAAVTSVKKYVKQEKIAFKAVIRNSQGQEIPYEKFSGEEPIAAVVLTFFTRQGEFKTTAWPPRNEDNFYALFLE